MNIYSFRLQNYTYFYIQRQKIINFMGNRLFKRLAENTGKRKFLHAIPIIGVILGIVFPELA